jgi:hypothetical protein
MKIYETAKIAICEVLLMQKLNLVFKNHEIQSASIVFAKLLKIQYCAKDL